jgi:hypothetical protein
MIPQAMPMHPILVHTIEQTASLETVMFCLALAAISAFIGFVRSA